MMLIKKLKLKKRGQIISMAILVSFILLDLATFHRAMYPKLFNLDRPDITPSHSFVRIYESYTEPEADDYYRVSYENYRAGQGVVDMCMPYMVQRGVYARGIGASNDNKPYFGEAVLSSAGKINSVDVKSNKVTVSMTSVSDGWLTLNQNYFPGWQTSPPREVINKDGLVAARVNKNDRQLTFFYYPPSYSIGKWITLSALLLMLVTWYFHASRPLLSDPKRESLPSQN